MPFSAQREHLSKTWLNLANMSAAYCVWNLEILRKQSPWFNDPMDEVSGSQSVIFEQAVSMSPGFLLEMQILTLILSYWVRNMREKDPALCVLTRAPEESDEGSSLRTLPSQERGKSNDNYNSLWWVLWSR